MKLPSHSKIINKVASESLRPIGLKRKGQSRIWIDDNGWWVTVIEFQPSSWSKGTYLNVGINWQWYPQEHFSFDIGYREVGFVEYENDVQFEMKMRELAEIAKLRVLDIRSCLSTYQSMKEYVLSAFRNIRSTVWSEFHQGMACAIAGDRKTAIFYLDQVIDNPHNTDWAIALKVFSEKIVSLIQSGEEYYSYINEVVIDSRKLKKLEPSTIRLSTIA